MKYYDSSKKQLIYIRQQADPTYWDTHWDAENILNIRNRIFNSGKNSFVARITRKYLIPSDGPILEGGCGLGSNVESLRLNGYQCIGIDNARKTVKILQDNIPELDIRYGDVSRLDFANDYFAGYWSLGVIEHFKNGYDDIAHEMLNVIKPGGYLFLTFPFMTYYRRIKAKLGLYKKFNNQDTASFYQFALNAKNVREDFEKIGFQLVLKKPRGVLYGLRDEVPRLSPIVNFILRHKDKSFFSKASYFIFDIITSAVFGRLIGNTILLVFKKVGNSPSAKGVAVETSRK